MIKSIIPESHSLVSVWLDNALTKYLNFKNINYLLDSFPVNAQKVGYFCFRTDFSSELPDIQNDMLIKKYNI